jgi:FkbM family methyltransferase
MAVEYKIIEPTESAQIEHSYTAYEDFIEDKTSYEYEGERYSVPFNMKVVKGDRITDAMVMCWTKDHAPTFLKYLKKSDIVVQAGGFNGLYPLLFSHTFRSVYTFEPHPLNFYLLNRNCQSDNVIKFNAALGDEHKMVGIHSGNIHNLGASSVIENGIIPQMRIDDLILPECDLIMLDIEGKEMEALKGAENTIRKFKPPICLEILSHPNEGENILEYLSQFGYKEREHLKFAGDKFYTVD